MTEELETEAREQAKKIEENQTLGVYDRDEDLEYDKGWNAGEVSGYEDGYIAGAEPREKQIAKAKEILNKLLCIIRKKDVVLQMYEHGAYTDFAEWSEVIEEVKQFLKE